MRAAIERMRLAPVMFELGARPHPPRELYRSYLEQSDVFVGIYAESYGWVAPDEQVSGLEDEYNLAPRDDAQAHLHQGKRPPRRAAQELIARIQTDDTAAYLPFDDGRRSRASGWPTTSRPSSPSASTSPRRASARRRRRRPHPSSPGSRRPTRRRSGASEDLAQVRRAARNAARTGREPRRPGRHRQEPPRDRGRRTPPRTSSPTEHTSCSSRGCSSTGLLLPTIAYVLGIRDTGEAGSRSASRAPSKAGGADRPRQLRADRGCRPHARAAVHGRARLATLPRDQPGRAAHPRRARLRGRAPADTRGRRPVERRARAPLAGRRSCSSTAPRRSSRSFDSHRRERRRRRRHLPAARRPAAGDRTRRREGPRCSLRTGIAQRLEHSLPLLTAAVRDLPERHRTMRATIDWSVGPAARRRSATCSRISACSPRDSPSRPSRRSGAGASWDGHGPGRAVATLVDASLVKQTEIDGRSTFSLLAIVREYAIGRLEDAAKPIVMRIAHADYYVGLVARRRARACAGRPDRCGRAARARAAEPPRGRAPPRLHGPARRRRRLRLEPPRLLVDLGILQPRCGCGCSSCSRRSSRSRSTPAPPRCSSRCGARCGSVRPPGRRRPRRVRAALHRERRRGCRGHGAGRTRDDAPAVPRPRCGRGRSRAERSRGRSSTSSATGGRSRSPKWPSGYSRWCDGADR